MMKTSMLEFCSFCTVALKTFVLIVFAICGTSAMAGTYVGKFQIQMWNENIYITPTGDVQRNNVPACATRTLVRLQESPDSATYKQKLAALLASWLTGHSVQLGGTGTCTSEGDEYIFMVNPQ